MAKKPVRISAKEKALLKEFKMDAYWKRLPKGVPPTPLPRFTMIPLMGSWAVILANPQGRNIKGRGPIFPERANAKKYMDALNGAYKTWRAAVVKNKRKPLTDLLKKAH